MKNDAVVILEMHGIRKTYETLVANDSVDLTLKEGEILALIGENGAGKTTLMKILYGLVHADSGSISIRGKEVHIHNAAQAIAMGIGMVQQHFMLFEPFTVAENVVYGSEPKKNLFFDIKKANNIVAELSQKNQLPLNPEAQVQGMPVGLRQRVEIFKVLYQNTDIIIFDEPTAVLTPQEVESLLLTMKHLAAGGKSIVIITHKLNEVMEVADRAVVLRHGKLVGDVIINDTTIEELSYLMVGRQLFETDIPVSKCCGDTLVVTDLCLKNEVRASALHNLSLHVSAGEIVGIAGVSGNGQSELVECLFGLRKACSGSVKIKDIEVMNLSVKDVRTAGVSLIPEDRYTWGGAVEATVSETAIMAHQRKPDFSKMGITLVKNIRNFVRKLVSDFSIKADSISSKTGSLSGGNIQKLIAAREIMQDTPLLIACEPTRGIDVGAMEFIHDRLIEKRANGDAVLLISSELTEILKLSDRIYVMYEGCINGEFIRGSVNEDELGLLMAGGKVQ